MPLASPPANSGAWLTKWSSSTATTCGLSADQSAPGAAVTETKSRAEEHAGHFAGVEQRLRQRRGLGLLGRGEVARARGHDLLARAGT